MYVLDVHQSLNTMHNYWYTSIIIYQYVVIYVCVSVCLYACIPCVLVCMSVWMYAQVCVCMYECVCLCINMCRIISWRPLQLKSAQSKSTFIALCSRRTHFSLRYSTWSITGGFPRWSDDTFTCRLTELTKNGMFCLEAQHTSCGFDSRYPLPVSVTGLQPSWSTIWKDFIQTNWH